MKHFGKLTTGAAALVVGVAMGLMPSGVGASSTSSTSTTSTTAPTTTSSGSTGKTTSASPTVGHWTVLVASFKTKAEAKTQLAQLRKLGFKHFHIVHVGADFLVRERHLHHSTAIKLVAKLKADGIAANAML